jgi:hypothetical protein
MASKAKSISWDSSVNVSLDDLGGGGQYAGQDPAQGVQHQMLYIQGRVNIVANSSSAHGSTKSGQKTEGQG